MNKKLRLCSFIFRSNQNWLVSFVLASFRKFCASICNTEPEMTLSSIFFFSE